MFKDDIETLVGRSVDALAQGVPGLPDHWRGYCDADPARRRATLEADLAPLRAILPRTCAALHKKTRDAFVIAERDTFIRVLNKDLEDDEGPDALYSFFSIAPRSDIAAAAEHRTFRDNAPRALGDLYGKCFDGLFDITQAGMLPLREMTRLSRMIDDFIDYPWYGALKSQPRLEDVALIFTSGGGGYLFLDLRIDQKDMPEPTCMMVMADRTEPFETALPLWEYLDVWISIALGD